MGRIFNRKFIFEDYRDKIIKVFLCIIILLILIVLILLNANFRSKNNKDKNDQTKVTTTTTTTTALSLNSQLEYMNIDNSIELEVLLDSDDSEKDDLKWTSSNLEVAEVLDGVVTAKSVGEAIITVTTKDNVTASCKIVVIKEVIDIEEIAFKNKSETINIGNDKTIMLETVITPENATNREIEWTSSNTNVASVDNGLVIVHSLGEVVITAKTSNGKTATCKITVLDKEINPTDVYLNTLSTVININSDEKNVNLTATVLPENATNKTIKWTSSNTNVATVSNGVVTAKSVGETVITAETANGKKATCKVTVQNKVVTVTGISLNKTSATLYLNTNEKTVTLSATVNPPTATDKAVTWSSSNVGVATVSDGVVTAKAIGETIITATTANGKTATCKISVQNNVINPTGISLNSSSSTVYLNSNTRTINLSATVSPSNATDKSVTWSSSNTSVATVVNGVVTVKDLGEAAITATTVNGKTATFNLYVKKKVIIEIGASQSTRFITYGASTYAKGDNTYIYNSSDELNSTLVHINKSGAGMDWQYSTASGGGYTRIKQVMDNYSSKKSYVEFYLYYLLIGNTIKQSSCNQINNNTSVYLDHLNGYSTSVNNLKSEGYNVKPFVVSMHPLYPNNADSNEVVSNTDSKYCTAGYRSNWKYNLFNTKIQSSISSYPLLTYVDTFNQIMDTSEATSSNRKYTYKVSYKCVDGIHWDEATAKMYLKLMLDQSNANL